MIEINLLDKIEYYNQNVDSSKLRDDIDDIRWAVSHNKIISHEFALLHILNAHDPFNDLGMMIFPYIKSNGNGFSSVPTFKLIRKYLDFETFQALERLASKPIIAYSRIIEYREEIEPYMIE